jgi:prolyl 4-hydroxylase
MLTLSSPGEDRLTCIDGFLPSHHCAAILKELRFAFWWPSTVTVESTKHQYEVQVSNLRISESTDDSWFTPQLLSRLGTIDRRLEHLVPSFRRRREAWQATHYEKACKFEYHLDAGHWAHEERGDRERTVLIYLNTPRDGGSTHFKILGVDVKARAGRLLSWQNLLVSKPDVEMLHASRPLIRGTKTVLITWVRQR